MSDQADSDLKIVRDAARRLIEHFDSVQILTSRHETGSEDGTVNVSYGLGNWFARYGQAKEWVLKSEERTRCDVKKEESE